MKKFVKIILMVIIVSSVVVLTGCDNGKTQNNVNGQNNEEIKITSENVQEKLGDHLKWAALVYLGSDYGLSQVYQVNDVTGTVNIPGVDDFMMIYEIVGVDSVQDLTIEASKYLSPKALSILNGSLWGSYTEGLREYNEKVYLVRDGIGDGPYIKTENAKVLSSENGISKVKLTDINVIGSVPEAAIILTIKYENGTYMITDCVIELLEQEYEYN